ncbi:PD-(D/E)XK nuclease family protein [Cylindrospermopsis raciborskii]|uniref:PD-(D/E)XK nuclease family protein n=1 Tax=Cylindrospermopsis raciborskii TaxID=77022 RepID=UPI003A8D8A3B
MTINDMDFKQLLKQQLPALIQEDVEVRDLLVRAISSYFAGSLETESHFDLVLGEIRRDREEQSRKWDENKRELELDRQEQARKWDENKQELELDRQEQARKWDENKQEFDRVFAQMELDRQEQARKWDENKQEFDQVITQMELDRQEQARKWDENKRELELDRQEQARKWDEQTGKWNENRQEFDRVIAAIDRMSRKHDIAISGLGSRWGLCSESSFRNGLKAILEESFGVEVLNIVEYDDQGIVFGRPDQVELDLIIRNGELIICEIKSSVSKADLYTFYRKVDFYQQQHQRQATRKIVISPMVHPSANSIASKLGIEIYSSSEDVSAELPPSPSL